MLKDKNILITCGPTWTPVDSVRVISNTSTGELGQRLALDLARLTASVTLLEGPVKQPLTSVHIKILKFNYFDELLALVKKELKKNYDVVIHAAAVGDYKLKKPFQSKLSSRFQTLTLKLIPTPKIIKLIKRINPGIFLVGFKQESLMTERLAKHLSRHLVENASCDLVVANASRGKKYWAYVVDKYGVLLKSAHSRAQLSKSLLAVLERELN